MVSIAFSTFDRAALLDQTLQNLRQYAVGTAGLVNEIVIALNGCTDDTEAVVMRHISVMADNGILLRYLINPTQLDSYKSYTRAINEVHNEWVWLFSDDDLIDLDSPNDLNMELLCRKYISIIILPWQSYEMDMRTPVGPNSIRPDCCGRIYPTLIEFVTHAHFHAISFWSCIILRRTIWTESTFAKAWKYRSTNYLQSFLILTEAGYSPCAVLRGPFIKNRLNYRLNGRTRSWVSHGDSMLQAWHANIALIDALIQLGDQDLLNQRKRHFVYTPIFVYQAAVIRAYHPDEYLAMRNLIRQKFNDGRPIPLMSVAELLPGSLLCWLDHHREVLRRIHRTYVRLSMLLENSQQ